MTRRQIGDYAVRGELEWGEHRVCVATRGQVSKRYLLVVLEIDDASAIELEDEILQAMELDHDNVMRPVETFADGDR